MKNWKFYRYRENWHKHPLVSALLCWMGRHDYELEKVLNKRHVALRCFYCLHRKYSLTSG